MKAMVMSQRLLCASLLIFFFFVMAAMAAENPQAKPTDVGDLDLGSEFGSHARQLLFMSFSYNIYEL